jgi:hypothetical protein
MMEFSERLSLVIKHGELGHPQTKHGGLNSMGISGSNLWRYVHVPYFWPYFVAIFPEF